MQPAFHLKDLREGSLKERLLDPYSCLLPDDEMSEAIPQPKVRVKDEVEWERLAHELVARGILVPVKEAVRIKDAVVTNGMFGVEKVEKDFPDGRTAQRLTMDLRASSSILQVLTGDIRAPAFTTMVLEESQAITILGEDLVSSFYLLFQLPPSWPPYLTFERPVRWRALGVDQEGTYPIGISSSYYGVRLFPGHHAASAPASSAVGWPDGCRIVPALGDSQRPRVAET